MIFLKLKQNPPALILLPLMTSLTELFKREPFLVLRSYESGHDFSILVDCTLKRDILDPEVVVAGIEFWECFITLESVSYKEEFRKRLFDM